MKIYNVSFAGHREIDDYLYAEKKLIEIISNLLITKEFLEFYVGDNGDFDILATAVIRQLRKQYGTQNSALNLVLSYKKANMKLYEEQFDSIIIPAEVQGVHYKKAITVKNRWIMQKSDFVICYIKRKSGGAYSAVKYAGKIGVTVCNIAKTCLNE